MSLVFRNGRMKGIGSVQAFDKFEKALIEFCERDIDANTLVPKINIIIRPRLREVINVRRSKIE